MNRLDGKVALLSGAARGIGQISQGEAVGGKLFQVRLNLDLPYRTAKDNDMRNTGNREQARLDDPIGLVA